MDADSQLEKRAISENFQRTVERTALRNVRLLAEKLEQEQAREERRGKRAMVIFAVAGALFAIGLLLSAVSSDRQLDRDQKIQLPDRITVPKNG